MRHALLDSDCDLLMQEGGDTCISRCNSLEIYKDRLFPEGTDVEKFGLPVCRSLNQQSGSDCFENAAAALWIFFYFVCVFLIFLWIQAKRRGSHGEISIAATELCSLLTVCCKNVRRLFLQEKNREGVLCEMKLFNTNTLLQILWKNLMLCLERSHTPTDLH